MKKVLFSLMMVFAAGSMSAVMAQEAVQLQEGAKIEFAKETHDYGEVKHGGNGQCTFDFTNTGSEPLIIQNAKGSCGCTVPSWPKEPLAPGKTASITVKYDTKRPGAINKSVTITSNAVNTPVKVIRIKGNVLPKPTSGAPVQVGGPTN
ncbi:MAG: DUF1573 domain-containing protein [Crocinitomicaceae bacterium]|nr:DUF1573 domain-containing protein [Crocinitomicaceae bacterium]